MLHNGKLSKRPLEQMQELARANLWEPHDARLVRRFSSYMTCLRGSQVYNINAAPVAVVAELQRVFDGTAGMVLLACGAIARHWAKLQRGHSVPSGSFLRPIVVPLAPRSSFHLRAVDDCLPITLLGCHVQAWEIPKVERSPFAKELWLALARLHAGTHGTPFIARLVAVTGDGAFNPSAWSFTPETSNANAGADCTEAVALFADHVLPALEHKGMAKACAPAGTTWLITAAWSASAAHLVQTVVPTQLPRLFGCTSPARLELNIPSLASYPATHARVSVLARHWGFASGWDAVLPADDALSQVPALVAFKKHVVIPTCARVGAASDVDNFWTRASPVTESFNTAISNAGGVVTCRPSDLLLTACDSLFGHALSGGLEDGSRVDCGGKPRDQVAAATSAGAGAGAGAGVPC